MTLALTLADYAHDPNPLVAGVAKSLRANSRFMDILPFPTTSSLSIKVVREGGMPSVSWRDVGSDHGSAKATKPDEIQEMAYSVGNEVQVDKVYLADKSARLYNPMTYQTEMTTKGIARNFTEKAILGLPSDLKNPVGLFYRVINDMGSDQRIDAGAGSGLDISPDATTLSTQVQTFLDRLDQLLFTLTDDVSDQNNVYFLTNDTVIMRFQSIMRQSGLLTQTQDAVGRVFTTYKGAKFIDMGRKADDSTRIMTNVELADGTALTGGASSRIYGVRIGNEYFTGWQEYALEVSPPELQANKVTYKSVIDWTVGLSVAHPRHSLATLYGIIAA